MTVKDAIKMLETCGWRECSLENEVRQYRHPDQAGFVTLAGKLDFEVPPGAMQSLRRCAQNEEDG